MLSARSVTVGHGGATLLHAVDLDLHPGEVVGLTGPSGCGKTSLARVVAGLDSPRGGQVLLDGLPRPRRPDGRVAMLFQSPRRACDPRLTLRRAIALCAATPDVDWARLCARADLPIGLLDRLPAQVSDGQLQRAALARALAAAPDYLLCDEVTAALDPAATAAVVASIRRAAADGAGVLFICHDVALVEACCDRVLQVRDTRVTPAHGKVRSL